MSGSLRIIIVLGAILAAASLLIDCSGGPVPYASIQAADCRTIDLIDEETREPVTGAEDLALDTDAGILYVSAYNRFALEDALDSKGQSLPRGGLYAVSINDLLRTDSPLPVSDLLWPLLGKGDVRPHGIDVYTGPFGNRILTAVVHRYAKEKGEWKRYSGLEVFRISDNGLRRAGAVEHPDLCQANDVVAVSPTQFLVTRDHGECGGWMWAEDVLALRRSTVMRVQVTANGALERPPVPVLSGIGFANGIAIDREQRRVVVAATREKALLIYNLDRVLSGNAGKPVGRISLPGGPDNLTITGRDSDPRVITAVHPSLKKMGFYRKRWFGARKAPSRLMTIDMKTAERGVIYNDPEGETFPAVTAGVQINGHIVMGSVGADGLRVCGLKEVTQVRDTSS